MFWGTILSRGDDSMEQQRFDQIFRPIYYKLLKKLDLRQMHFAYYTSAMTGLNILKDRSLWMRAAACMNDYREIDYGIQLLNQSVYSSDERRRKLREIAGKLRWGDNILEYLLGDLNRNKQNFITHTYLACVTEHDLLKNEHGRLSMWRAYGRKTGVAFVLKPSAIIYPTSTLPLQISPVKYETQEDFDHSIDYMLWHIERNIDVISSYKPMEVLEQFIHVILLSLFSVKHPGFQEEQEWRIIYQDKQKEKLDYSIVSVDGIPQIVYRLPLYGPEDAVQRGISMNDALEHIIIGPTQYGDVIFTAFVKILEEMGIERPADRVYISNIPLR